MKIFNRLLDTAMDQVDKRVDQSKDAINERYEDAMRRAEELIFEAKCVVAVGVGIQLVNTIFLAAILKELKH